MSKYTKCPYCHSDGSRYDNKSVWGSKEIPELNNFSSLVINLSNNTLTSANAIDCYSIKYCPMCNRNLGED